MGKNLMTSNKLDHQESTWVFDYPSGTAEFYTTDRRAFLRAITRNPEYLRAHELNPGYSLTYALKDCRSPESVIRPADGGAEFVAQHWLTSTEKENRATASERLKKVRLNTATDGPLT